MSDSLIYGAIEGDFLDSSYDINYSYNIDLNKMILQYKNDFIDYNWLLTDCRCYFENHTINELFEKDCCFLSGEELINTVAKENLMWEWGVLSGFDKTINLQDILNYTLPYSEYSGFWDNPATIQNPLAMIELVAWHGVQILIFSNKIDIVNKFMKIYPKSIDIEKYNNR